MKFSRHIFSALAILICYGHFAQGGFEAHVRLTAGANHITRDIYEISPGQYIALGIPVYVVGSKIKSRMVICELNSVGDTVWTKSYGSDVVDHTNALGQRRSSVLKDDGIVQVSCLKSDTSVNYFGTLLKFSFQGNIIWQRYYRDSARHFLPRCIAPANDGGYLIAGQLQGETSTPSFLIKTDAAGNEQWRSVITTPPPNFSQLSALIQDSATGKIILGGFQHKNGTHDFLVVLDSTGTELFRNNRYPLGGTYNDIVRTSDQKYVTVGYLTDNEFLSRYSNFAYKFDVDDPGTAIWELSAYRGYSLVNNFDCVTELKDNSILICGTSDSLVEIKQRYNFLAHLLKLNLATGAIMWEKTINYELDTTQWNILRLVSVNPTADNGWILAMEMENVDNNPLLYVKFDSTGCDKPLSGVGLKEEKLLNPLSVFPNPATGALYIDAEDRSHLTAVISDLHGRILMERELERGRNTLIIPADKGIYVLTARGKDGVLVHRQKIVRD